MKSLDSSKSEHPAATQGDESAPKPVAFLRDMISELRLERHTLRNQWRIEALEVAIAALSSPPGVQAAQVSEEADDLLREWGLDPERFRSEGGWLNPGKIRAAILNPRDYDELYLAAAQAATKATPGTWIPVKPEGAPYWGIHTTESVTIAGTSSGLSEADAALICRMHAALAHPSSAAPTVEDSADA